MTEEEKQELEALRAEKHQRTQTERARAALAGAGVPASFAPLLIGRDESDTDAKVEQFCTAYRSALSEDVRRRLPQHSPVLTPPQPQRPRRGVQRLR